VGVVDIVAQGVLLGLLLRLMGDRGVVLAGIAGMGVSSGLIALVGSLVPASWLLVVALLTLAVTQGASTATLQGLLSGRAGGRATTSRAGSRAA
jgi:MFS transporter, DHA1 family, tetracycline resistance protein